MWQAITAFLVWLSADSRAVDVESPRAAAAVAYAYAALAVDASPPSPAPQPGCCKDCKSTGFITHGDGHRTACPCPADCRCKKTPGSSSAACETGDCKVKR